MFWLSNKKNNFLLHTLIWGPDCLSCSLCMLHDNNLADCECDLHSVDCLSS